MISLVPSIQMGESKNTYVKSGFSSAERERERIRIDVLPLRATSFNSRSDLDFSFWTGASNDKATLYCITQSMEKRRKGKRHDTSFNIVSRY